MPKPISSKKPKTDANSDLAAVPAFEDYDVVSKVEGTHERPRRPVAPDPIFADDEDFPARAATAVPWKAVTLGGVFLLSSLGTYLCMGLSPVYFVGAVAATCFVSYLVVRG